MKELRDPLALGMELIALLVFSYYFHETIAQLINFDPNLMLAILMGGSLFIWTVHAYFVMAKK